jgi:hypothetical protein
VFLNDLIDLFLQELQSFFFVNHVWIVLRLIKAIFISYQVTTI